MKIRHRPTVALAMMCALSLYAANAQAQRANTTTIVVPTAPGGGIDIYGRLLAKELTELGRVAIVENRAGGGTSIGASYVARSAPNGQTLLITVNTHTINAAIAKSLPYDPMNDLAPITILGSQPFVIGVAANTSIKSLDQLITLARDPNSKIAYASCGPLTAQHLAGELLKSMTGANMLHVPYKGCAPAATDLAGDQVPAGIITYSAAYPLMQAGRIRALAQTGIKRSPLLPDVPTVAEAVHKDYNVDQWWGIFAPAATPSETIERLHADIAKIVRKESVAKTLVEQGIDPVLSTPQEFATFLRSDVDRWAKLAKAINLDVQ